ncbi:DUF805 domain-containing protein [Fictibacillus sp. KU28468]|uniref:DUF805 domain-containing protein n=1 Tax=Fictibacillus sp. KU28468 TaxID=2991053 RepID=UPI00223DEC25|nr:DUF805 domain-containing protein [Fictibacillus sp. KU28468]UZJ79356.1 DUF805 domain-containing protein [Fictibacillus sp. KU28468]
MNWYLKVFKNYIGFKGRARRKEYWMFTLFNLILLLILNIIEKAAHLEEMLTGIYSFIVLIPSLAVGARRLHDTGRSGWWQLLNLIPLIGSIILIVFFAQKGEENENFYGKNPILEEDRTAI